MKSDPHFPKKIRPPGLGNVTLFKISDVEAYEQSREAKREDLIHRIVTAVERELRRGVSLSRAYAAMRKERWK
jgi:hypothetical protein